MKKVQFNEEYSTCEELQTILQGHVSKDVEGYPRESCYGEIVLDKGNLKCPNIMMKVRDNVEKQLYTDEDEYRMDWDDPTRSPFYTEFWIHPTDTPLLDGYKLTWKKTPGYCKGTKSILIIRNLKKK